MQIFINLWACPTTRTRRIQNIHISSMCIHVFPHTRRGGDILSVHKQTWSQIIFAMDTRRKIPRGGDVKHSSCRRHRRHRCLPFLRYIASHEAERHKGWCICDMRRTQHTFSMLRTATFCGGEGRRICLRHGFESLSRSVLVSSHTRTQTWPQYCYIYTSMYTMYAEVESITK